ncbi:MAG: helix-turn-helix domain-containing protein [Proteobacteria bacterium]|nr:helix-turn-helix domain-containing protein [Pseudomonadota bacterium]MBU1739901.1 helix-turn-helix domain-containing protein [Pseudomonadota bacterium]
MRRAGAQEKTAAVRQGPRLLPLKAAAEYLGLTPWALRERAWAGQIPVVKWPNGRKWFFDRDDLEAFIDRNKVTIT